MYEEKEEGHIRAYSVGELLKKIGWATVDYVKCDIEGAEAEVFSEPHCAEWVAGTGCISVEMHDRFRPGCTEIVEAALSAADFDRCQSGEYSVFIRRQSRFGKVKDNGVESEVLQLAPTSLRPLRFRLVNVSPEPWGFMIIDENTFQLHPNNPGEPPAEMEFTIELSGQKQFSTRISVEGFGTQDVIFSVTMSEHDGIAFAEERQVGPGQMVDWIFSTFPRVGRHRVILSTRMAPGAQNHGGAWARWVAPRLRGVQLSEQSVCGEEICTQIGCRRALRARRRECGTETMRILRSENRAGRWLRFAPDERRTSYPIAVRRRR